MRREQRVDHDDLRAVEHPLVTVAARRGLDAVPVVPGRRFGRGHRNDGRSTDEVLQHVLRGITARALQQAARDDDGVDEGFDDQRVAQRLGDHHRLDRTATDSAGLLGQRRPQNAQLFGESTPDVGLPALAEFGRGPAGLQVVTARQELGEPVAQQFLFLGQVEVHQCSRQSPRAALARMFR